MKLIFSYFLTVIFAIFLGSQITEGILLVPHWQSLSAEEFYSYYNEFGHGIGRYFTILTIVAALIPIILAVYYYIKKSPAFLFAATSSLFAILFIAAFYIYFKDVNELFFAGSLSEENLKAELITWKNWHWGRVGMEFLSLVFLILAFVKIKEKHELI